MAPKAQRSRACAQCRKRRVKCDETPETCKQCRRLGLECSGPVVGSIVIDMTDKMAKPRGRAKKETTRAAVAIREKSPEASASVPNPQSLVASGEITKVVDMPVPNPMFPRERRYTSEVERAVTAIRHQYRPPTYHQPAQVRPDALDLAFLSHYVQLNAGSRTYSPEIQWLNHLPRIHAEATKPAVRLSLRAVSMAFYGKMHHDPSILVDSWRWYTVSLNAQRQSISRLQGGEIPSEGEVMVPLILALYEVYVGTTASGAMTHLTAAGNIMNMRGPNNVKSGAIWPLFKGIRNAEAHRCIIFNRPSLYSTEEWMRIPFEGVKKDAHQRLADIELTLPICMQKLQISGNLRRFFATPIAAHVDVEPCRALTLKLIEDIHQWAREFPNLTNIAKDPQDVINSANRSAKGLDIANDNAQSPPLPDTFVALIASNYVATKLALFGLMHKMATQSVTPPQSPEATATDWFAEAALCAKAILRGAENVENAQTPGFDLLRSIGPLVSVVCIGPGEEQFRAAGVILQRWTTKIGGLGSILQNHILV